MAGFPFHKNNDVETVIPKVCTKKGRRIKALRDCVKKQHFTGISELHLTL
jgi:predicted RNA-binding protein YlqC (UPF0109 family)